MPSLQTTSLEAGLGFRLDRLVRTLRGAWASQLADLDLTPPQAAVVRGVADAEGTSVRALARRLGGDPMNTKRCVDELERRGLVVSTSDPEDRRPRHLALTERGRDAAVEIDRRVASQNARLTRSFSPGDRARFEAGLAAIESEIGVTATSDPENNGSPAGPSAGPGAASRRPAPTRSVATSTPHHARRHEEHR